MIVNFTLSFVSAGAALLLWPSAGPVGWLARVFLGLSLWHFYSALTHRKAARLPPPIVRLGGFSWQIEDFCRGWLITGQVGSGKTNGAINSMLWQVSRNCPNWGGVCVDDKGLYWETLTKMLQCLGREQDLVLLQVRPADAGPSWKPAHTFNFLDNPHLPYSAKAKIVCDVAASLGQRSEQSFFRLQAQMQIEFAFRVLAAAGCDVTLKEAYNLLTGSESLAAIMKGLERDPREEVKYLKDHYKGSYLAQPVEQLGGVTSTISNYLNYFTDPAIAEIFCPQHSSFSFDAIDKGKILCVSIPQRYQIERRYINTLLKLTFYAHALRRFDKPAVEREKDNLLILWADEAQKIVTASDDGMSDYNVVDVIRESKATVVAATQSYQSLMPPMGDEKKARVFIANMANRINFRAADEESAKLAADTLGKRRIKKRTTGYSGGKRTYSSTDEDRYWMEPHELRRLLKFQAVVQHCNGGFRKVTLPPIGADGNISPWYHR